MTSFDSVTRWREDWSSSSVVNHTIVIDPTIRQPSFDIPRHTWSPMNRFRTGQSPCRANLHKRGLAQSPSCDCGQRETTNHTVDTWPLTKFKADWIYSEHCDSWLLCAIQILLLTYLLTPRSGQWPQSYSWNLQRLQHSRNNNNIIVVIIGCRFLVLLSTVSTQIHCSSLVHINTNIKKWKS